MAEIRNFWVVSHLRSEQTRWVALSKGGSVRKSGRGLSFWYQPLATSLSEVPTDDRELAILFHARSADFQDVVVQGVLSWRVVDPERVASRIDFSIDPSTGEWQHQPMEQVAMLLTQSAQQVAWGWLAGHPLATVLQDGVATLRERIGGELASHAVLGELGIEVVAVRIASVKPSSEVEKALQTPAREAMQQAADRATYERRANAVERERAIAENELQNQIELARREEELIAQRATNDRRRVEAQLENQRLSAEGAAQVRGIEAHAESEQIRLVEAARNEAEEARTAIWRDLSDSALAALVGRELAASLPHIEHLSVTPELLTPALARLAKGA